MNFFHAFLKLTISLLKNKSVPTFLFFIFEKEQKKSRKTLILRDLLFLCGETGIRTPGTFRYHWFSRPAPSTARPSLHNGTSFVSIPRFHRFVKRKFTFFREKCAARGITAAVRRPGAPESRRERQRSWSEKRLRIHAPFPRSAGSPSA